MVPRGSSPRRFTGAWEDQLRRHVQEGRDLRHVRGALDRGRVARDAGASSSVLVRSTPRDATLRVRRDRVGTRSSIGGGVRAVITGDEEQSGQDAKHCGWDVQRACQTQVVNLPSVRSVSGTSMDRSVTNVSDGAHGTVIGALRSGRPTRFSQRARDTTQGGIWSLGRGARPDLRVVVPPLVRGPT